MSGLVWGQAWLRRVPDTDVTYLKQAGGGISDIAVIGALALHCRNDGSVEASYAVIGRWLGTDRRTAQRVMRRTEKRGLVTRLLQRTPGGRARATRWLLLMPSTAEICGGSEPTQTESVEGQTPQGGGSQPTQMEGVDPHLHSSSRESSSRGVRAELRRQRPLWPRSTDDDNGWKKDTTPRRGDWCGQCDNPTTRFVATDDGRVARCPRCHPMRRTTTVTA